MTDPDIIERARQNGWGFPRENLKPGTRLLQGPNGDRAYVVTSLEEKHFCMQNLETGQPAREDYKWLFFYKELAAPNGKSELHE